MTVSCSNHTPCNFKEKDGTGCNVSIVDKVGCYGREMPRSANHFNILHARKGSPKLEGSRLGKEIRRCDRD